MKRHRRTHNENALAPSRRGKIGTTLHFDPEMHRNLKYLAVEMDTTITALLFEGVNLMLFSYGRLEPRGVAKSPTRR